MRTHMMLFASLSLVTACSGGGGPSGPGTTYNYVQSSMLVPLDDGQAIDYGLDLDGNGQRDNKLGSLLGLLASQGADVQGGVDRTLSSGRLVILHQLTDHGGDATWQVYVGDPASNPDFSGAGTFTISSSSPDDAMVNGALTGSSFRGGPATVTVKLPLGTVPVTVHLEGARIQGSATESDCSVLIGGALSQHEIDTVVLPAAAEMINMYVADHPSSSGTLLSILDLDSDGTVTGAELHDNPLAGNLLSPDVDMDGNDGVKDAVSLGVKVGCVTATF